MKYFQKIWTLCRYIVIKIGPVAILYLDGFTATSSSCMFCSFRPIVRLLYNVKLHSGSRAIDAPYLDLNKEKTNAIYGVVVQILDVCPVFFSGIFNDPTYLRNGDYLFPDLQLEKEDLPIGKYGLLRKRYLKEHKRGWYSSLLLTGKLNLYLAEIDRTCTERVELIMNQLAQREGVTEALKASDQMEWVVRMNNFRARAEEIVLSELVYC